MINGRLMRSVALFLLLFSCSFFTADRPQSAKDSYSISTLPPTWKKVTNKETDYIFYGPHGASLMIQSFCDEFQSSSLSNLAQTTFTSLGNATIREQGEFMLQERVALKSQGEAIIDGVAVELTLVNSRRNNCYYDFLEVLPHKNAESVMDHFLKGITFR